MTDQRTSAVTAEMLTARALVERHIAVFGYVPHPDRMKEAIADALSRIPAQPMPDGEALALEKKLASASAQHINATEIMFDVELSAREHLLVLRALRHGVALPSPPCGTPESQP